MVNVGKITLKKEYLTHHPQKDDQSLNVQEYVLNGHQQRYGLVLVALVSVAVEEARR